MLLPTAETNDLDAAQQHGQQSVKLAPQLQNTDRCVACEVLLARLKLAQGLSNQEMSERLFLALDMVKGHNQNILGKLHVQRRTEAVARARELGLL